MVKRNSTANADSLDLLLDTLTNSFGAFLLVALLIAILVTDTSQSEAAPSNVQLKVLENLELEIDTLLKEAENLQNRIEFLYAEVKRLPATISEEEVHLLKGQLAEILVLQEEQTETLNRIVELNATIVELAAEIANKKDATERENRLQDNIDDIVDDQNAKMRELKIEVASSQRVLLSLKEQLDKKEENSGKQQREIQYPRVRDVEEKDANGNRIEQFPFVLKAGSLYHLTSNDLVPSNTGYIQLKGKLYRLTQGVKIVDVRNITELFDRVLSRVDPTSIYIKIFVWEDSFTSWNEFRMELGKLGHRFQLVPMAANAKIYSGSSKGRVQ
jgi:hypothetical protein